MRRVIDVITRDRLSALFGDLDMKLLRNERLHVSNCWELDLLDLPVALIVLCIAIMFV